MKKYRNEHCTFVAEGNKLVADMLFAFECELLIAKPSWMATQGNIPATELLEADDEDLRKSSFQKTPQDVLAVFRQPSWNIAEVNAREQLVLVLDGIQDPGNLGTIIRLCGWFGIEHIVCSQDTADVFNPKAIQATMGALAHVKVHYADLEDFLSTCTEKDIPIYGTFLDGENIYGEKLTPEGILIMGNEGNGIHPEIETFISKRLYIPNYPAEREVSDSLNVAVATAIVCAEFRRRNTIQIANGNSVSGLHITGQ